MDVGLQLDLSLRILLGRLSAIAARIHPMGSRAITMRIEIASLHVLGAASTPRTSPRTRRTTFDTRSERFL